MINKQSLWFLTLFSLILVLSIYYITMPNELLLNSSNKNNLDKLEKTSSEIDNVKSEIKESELLVTMRVNLDEERDEQVADLKTKLTKEDTTSEEKNAAYEEIKYITNLGAQEEQLEQKIKKEFGIDCFIKINNQEIKVVAAKDEHDITLANNIMKSIQNEFSKKMLITIQFEK